MIGYLHSNDLFILESTMATQGEIIQVIGSTFDAQFSADEMPEIYNAVTVDLPLVPVIPANLGPQTDRAKSSMSPTISTLHDRAVSTTG